MKPLISVIIPMYNCEKTVKATIESVLAQTYENIEIICVNDGSKDTSAGIVSEIAQTFHNVKIINKDNQGVSLARLDGVRVANGDYIGFIDSDDHIDPGMYEHLFDNAEKHGADISHCGYRLVKPDGIKYFYDTGEKMVQDRIQGISELLKGEKVEPGLCNKLFKKELFSDLLVSKSGMDFSIKNNEDLLMNYILFKKAEKSVFEDFCPYEYIVYENSASKGKINEHKLYDPVKAAKLIYYDCDESLKLIAADLYITKLIYAATFYGENANTVKEPRSLAQKELRSFIKIYLGYRTSIRRKLLALFAAYLPGVYDVIHRIYLR